MRNLPYTQSTNPGLRVAVSTLLLCLAIAQPALGAPPLSPLSSADHWRAEPGAWKWEGNVLHGSTMETSLAVTRGAAMSTCVVIEALVTPEAILGDNWKNVGIGVHVDAENFWALSLIESPDADGSSRESEFSEMRGGQWLANESLEQLVDEGSGKWDHGKAYRFRLTLESGRIDGEIRDADGGLVLRRAYRLDDQATAMGRPSLRVVGVNARFADLRASMSEPVETRAQVAPPPFTGTPPVPGVKGHKTGFFHVEDIDDRWWVIDPNGQATLGLAVDHVLYNGPWCTRLNTFQYRDNNDARYASRAEWEEQTLQRLESWDFSLMAIGEDPSLRHRGLAHCEILNIAYYFTALGDAYDITPYLKRPGTMFPNVFHPDFEAWLDYYVEETCAKAAEDPWLFGYLLDNELAWWGKQRGSWSGMFDAVLLKSADHTAKVALRDYLHETYGMADALNRAWGTDVASWDEVLSRTELGSNDNPETVRAKEGFLAKAADAYFRKITEAIRRHDPNHMILGCRFAGGRANEAIWQAAGKYCDIVSFNYYGSVDLDNGTARSDHRDNMARSLTEVFTDFYRQCRRPMMITEWAFIGLDADLPSTKGAGQRFRTQAERAEATGIYLSTMLRMPFMVGHSWFKHIDQPKLGIRPEFGENANYGLVNVHDRPYETLVATFTRVQGRAAELHLAGPVPEEGENPGRAEVGVLPGEWVCGDALAERAPEPPLHFERRGKGFIASNGRIEIESVDGKGGLTSRLSVDGLEVGRYNAMVCQVAETKRAWCGAQRLENVRALSGDSCMEIELTGSWGTPDGTPNVARTFEVTHRLTLLPDMPWMVVRLDHVHNTSDRPLQLDSVYFRPFSAIRGQSSDDYPTESSVVPRLWKGNASAAWLDPQGGFFGLVTPGDDRVRVRFWVDPQDGQHPDAYATTETTIPPGETWRPARPLWAVLAMGHGGATAWEAEAQAVSR